MGARADLGIFGAMVCYAALRAMHRQARRARILATGLPGRGELMGMRTVDSSAADTSGLEAAANLTMRVSIEGRSAYVASVRRTVLPAAFVRKLGERSVVDVCGSTRTTTASSRS